MDQKTLEIVNQFLPEFVPEVTSSNGWSDLRLPAPGNADYSYALHEEAGDGERQISARLIGDEITRNFWYWPLELADFKSDAHKLRAFYYEIVKKLLTQDTRIVYKRGWIWDTFQLEVLEEGRWVAQKWMTNLKIGVGPGPKIKGRIRIYCSPPIAMKSGITN